ncbi:hypothetical protein IJG96_01570 [Candidatus Saccharibacteria bacterium]|nr:hypothetical protein [Candidatus Saccharibacteria bacterium]
MKKLGRGVIKIFRNDKALFLLMILLFIVGTTLALHTFLHFKGNGTTLYIGYSDIGRFSGGDPMSLWSSGGYRTGGWKDMIAFPILGAVLGVMHNLYAVKVYLRKGKGYAYSMVIVSLVMGAILMMVLMRLLGEI